MEVIKHNGSTYQLVTMRDGGGVQVSVTKDGEPLLHVTGQATAEVASDYEGQLDEKIEVLLAQLMADEIKAGRV